MNVVTDQKLTLEAISDSIQNKRNEKLDSLEFPFTKLVLSDYDIREDRDITKLKEDLVRDGQLQVMTLSLNNGIYTVVNGRTRYLAIEAINKETPYPYFKTVKVEVYEDLTELEQNYLNAQINVSQNPLTPNEKVNFVKKYKDILDPKALGKALGIKDNMLENYLEVADVDEEVLKAFRPKTEGYGRSDIKVEELGNTNKAYKQVSGGKAPDKETSIELGKKFETLDLTRDIKRKAVKRIAKTTAKLEKNPTIKKKYTPKQIVDIATKESVWQGKEGGSGDTLPVNSSKKYKIVDKLLKDDFDFSLLLFAEGLYRKDGDTKHDSETKRVVDHIDEITVVGNEIEKLTEIEDYCDENNKTITVVYKDVIDYCFKMKGDDRKGFIYVNGASKYAQRPEFINFLKKKFPNSTIAVVVLDLLFGKSQVHNLDRLKEIITVYEGANNFDDVIAQMKKRVKYLKLRKYSDTPQKKYIAFV